MDDLGLIMVAIRLSTIRMPQSTSLIPAEGVSCAGMNYPGLFLGQEAVSIDLLCAAPTSTMPNINLTLWSVTDLAGSERESTVDRAWA
jgi:hypothetical protein